MQVQRKVCIFFMRKDEGLNDVPCVQSHRDSFEQKLCLADEETTESCRESALKDKCSWQCAMLQRCRANCSQSVLLPAPTSVTAANDDHDTRHAQIYEVQDCQ